jgi:hypothetical protein
MERLTLQQTFGVNVSQDASNLYINKLDFPKLANNFENRGESLLVAILLNLHSNFEGNVLDENNSAVTDELNRPITFSNLNLYELLNAFYWKRQFVKGKIIDTFVVEHNAIS